MNDQHINGHARAETSPSDSETARTRAGDTVPPGAGLLLSLFNRLAKLNADELDAIDYLVEKLEAGRLKHGPLDLDSDTRDWFAEVCEERADIAHYEAFAIIQQRRRAVR